MDYLYINSIAFPIRNGTFRIGKDSSSEYDWGIEINCEESPHFRDWSEEREEEPTDWLAGTEPYLYAQMLPLRVKSVDDLVGQVFTFPQTPDDELPDWPEGIGWPFFVLYLFEHDLVYPMQLAFIQKKKGQFRVEITGKYPQGDLSYDLRIQAWLDWQG
jgi:hypothetical protein